MSTILTPVMEITVDSQFDELEEYVLKKAREGAEAQAEAVKEYAKESMLKAPSPKDHAPEGEPPYEQTGKFKRSLEVGERGGFFYVGPKYSEVGLRGAWFEFGGRPQSPETQKRSRRSTKRKWKNHPFIEPALKAELGNFAQRVAGAFIG